VRGDAPEDRERNESPPPRTNEQSDPEHPTDDSRLITPEAETAIRRLGELDSTPLESYAEIHTFAQAGGLFDFLQSWPLAEQHWAFRGHADENWKLQPSLERLALRYDDIRGGAESYVLRAFKRRAHHYLRDLPEERETLEWLALMRHHGAPTRLLDWTKSPYVAAFFATAEAGRDDTSAIWAIDLEAIRREAMELLREAGSSYPGTDSSFSTRDAFNAILMGETRPAIVAPVQPFRTNERVTSQQGLFLCANSLNFPGFEIGLKQVLESDRERCEKILSEQSPKAAESVYKPRRLFKLLISPSARRQVLKELHRMNINYATLFPGLDGFAQSLNTVLTMSEPMENILGSGPVDEEV
jgi:hypothetical protein